MNTTKIRIWGLCLLMAGTGAVRAETFTEEVSDVWHHASTEPGATWSDEEVWRFDYESLLSLARRKRGYAPLFAEDLSDALLSGESWNSEDGVLSTGGGKQNIWTQEKYGDFALELEFKCEENTNSGIILRCGNTAQWVQNSIEVQILQPEAGNGRHDGGGIFDCLAPAARAVKPAGEWNRFLIVAAGPRIIVLLNDVKTVDMNLDHWTEAGRNPDGTPNKYKKAYKDMPREGSIGLQDHGQPVWFRNLRIKRL